MSNNDLPMQLHFALFRGSGGFVLKPPEMLGYRQAPVIADVFDLSASGSDAEAERISEASAANDFWPPPREQLHRATIELLTLHNLPTRNEQRPRYSGSRSACHKFHPELSGIAALPDNLDPCSPELRLSIYATGGTRAPLRCPQPSHASLQRVSPTRASAALSSPQASARSPTRCRCR